MIVIACTAALVLAGIYVLVPLFREPKGNLAVELLAETNLDRLLNRKAVVYGNLKDLEFEYKMGRLGDADFRRLENGYKLEAAAILQQLDNLGVETDVDETIEKEVAARKGGRAGSTAAGRAPAAVGKCPACGSELIAGKKFCADCGRRI
jgi:hypothetical protein